MYPNYVGSEAVLASENLVFMQSSCDAEAFSACLHPFIRNAVGCMEFGGTFLNKRMNRGNDGGNIRRTTDVFELATAVLFQNPIQNFALAPNNLTDAPQLCLDFMRNVPTTWDETRFIDGYPGKYVVLARRHGNTWYVAAINATDKPMKLNVELPMLNGKEVTVYNDGKNREPQSRQQKIKSGKDANHSPAKWRSGDKRLTNYIPECFKQLPICLFLNFGISYRQMGNAVYEKDITFAAKFINNRVIT